ncbi:MAG: hypothetical protein WCF10_18435 [Polyangiales bacterium]
MLLTLGCRSAKEPHAGEDQAFEPDVASEQLPRVRSELGEEPTTEPDGPVLFVEDDEGREEELEAEVEEDLTKDVAMRDLAAELKAAVGIPSDCVRDFEASGRTRLQVNVSATVRPSGAIILPDAFGSGLSNDARRCITRRVDAVVLKPLDGEVSQRVFTIIEIDYVPPAIFASDPGMPEPQLRNVREPLPPRREVAPSGTPIQDRSGRPIQEQRSRPIQEPSSRKIRGPKPRAIDGYEVDENAKEWR